MPTVEGSCEYFISRDDPTSWEGEVATEALLSTKDDLLEDGVWTCPHDAVQGERLCIFHLPPEKKDNQEATRKFFEKIETATNYDSSRRAARTRQFLGAKFDRIDLTDTTISGGDHQINLKFADIDVLRWRSVTCEPHLQLTGAHIGTRLRIGQSDLPNGVDMTKADIDGRLYMGSSTIATKAKLSIINVDEVSFPKAVFNTRLDLHLATIHNDLRFSEAKLEERGKFENAEINGTADFSEVDGSGNFTGVKFADVSFRDATLEGSSFRGADLQGADFSEARIQGALLEGANLTQANLFGTQLQGCRLYGAVLTGAQINEETDFGDYCVYDPKSDGSDSSVDLQKAAGHYRILEELGRRNAFTEIFSWNFIRRQEIYRKQHWTERRVGRYLRATASKKILLYGESPWRIIGWSLGIILTFALLFPLGGWIKSESSAPVTYAEIATSPIEFANAIYYSTLTFTALGFGDFQPVGLGRALTTVETGLGAVLLALLVWVFGRRTAR